MTNKETMNSITAHTPRHGGQILVDQLTIQGCKNVFLVPGESYLPVLDALCDNDIMQTVCRQEGGAAMMAEADGKLTGRPGICFVTRGPGATNASAGVHIAQQDSTPMILFVGQVDRSARGRDAFQELDYHAVFHSMAKWVVEIDDINRIPELISRAYSVAMSGRPGPVVVALPEDMLRQTAVVTDSTLVRPPVSSCSDEDCKEIATRIAASRQPLVIVGGSAWTAEDHQQLALFAERFDVPVATSFRRQSLFSMSHTHYAGHLSTTCDPKLSDYVRSSDLVILIGGRMGELPSQNYSLLNIPNTHQRLVHVHPCSDELNTVYSAELAIACKPGEFIGSMLKLEQGQDQQRNGLVETRHQHALHWMKPTSQPGSLNIADVIIWLGEQLANDAIICNGAGNYATWVHRFFPFTQYGTQLAPISGSMGYGLPAAVAAKRTCPDKHVVAFAGDGCFMMHGQEFMTAVQYDLPILVIVIDNGMYGTIRMHQERDYPGRVSGTTIKNPDFVGLAKAYGGHGELVRTQEDFPTAFQRAQDSGKPAILHCIIDPEALTIDRTLTEVREHAFAQANSSCLEYEH